MTLSSTVAGAMGLTDADVGYMEAERPRSGWSPGATAHAPAQDADRRRAGEAGRFGDYYGDEDAEWNPYHPHSTASLAEYAAELVRDLEYAPEILTLRDSVEEVFGPLSPAGPAVLIVDPWAADDARLRLRGPHGPADPMKRGPR
ncbi:FxsC protein [Sphaerisporangium dianthi]|uniref:FxsC protein n=1 Tax=Sphaerisporangium dianthi TaxID=1436120 RepID=A0ABV9CFA0_9ACTN